MTKLLRSQGRLPLLLVLVSGVLQCAGTTVAAELAALATALESIRAEELKAHTDTLADDAFEGREAGTRGGHAASTYVMKKLEAYGLEPGGDRGSYYQQFGSYRNVLAVLPGSDEKLKDEYIVVGAHIDHVGYGQRKNSYGAGYIHNGADDNASGTAALLELAQSFAHLPAVPRRSILFAFWDAEEKGLLGSKHWMKQPTVPIEQVRFNVNVDMVGRMTDDKVIVYGTRTAPGLRQLVARANQRPDLTVSYVWWINPRSDHYTFVKNKIPVLMLHTGLHNDYHRPSDDAHKLNAEGMERITQLFFGLAYELADGNDVPAWRKEGAWESSAQRKVYEALPAASPPRLGVTWDAAAERKAAENGRAGVTIKSVARDSAAKQAGLRVGDAILSFDGHAIATGDDLRRRVLSAGHIVRLTVRRPGEQQPLALAATLRGKPVELGISWRQNSAEPGVVTIVRVLPGSPAEQAGIRRLDRVYAVDGKSLDNIETLENLKLPDEGGVMFQIERDGHLLTREVHPLDAASLPQQRER